MEKETLKSLPARSAVCNQRRRHRLPQCVNFFSSCLYCYSSASEEEHVTEEETHISSPCLQAEIAIEAPISLSGLQEEILVQIFNKLPIRYAIRCQAVCKRWRCLISNPLFKSTFNHTYQPLTLIPFPPKSSNNPHPVLSYEIFGSDNTNPLVVGKPWRLPADFNFPVTDITVLGSYNGLVALHHVTADWSSHSFCLFNPITMEKKLVHLRFPLQLWGHFWTSKLSCDASGLCHDPANDEYKVVVISSRKKMDTILVVSFKDNSWKYKPKSTPKSFKKPFVTGFFRIGTTVEGTPYWICYPDTVQSPIVCYFDCQNEELRVAELPIKASMRGVGALDGKLTVALVGERTSRNKCEVWALNKYGNDNTSSWKLLFVMPVDTYYRFKLLSWRKDEWVVYANEEGMVIHDVFRKQNDRVGQLQFSRRRCCHMDDFNNMVAYFPSFSSPITVLDLNNLAPSNKWFSCILAPFLGAMAAGHAF